MPKWDGLFQALTKPDELKSYLEANLKLQEGQQESSLQTQLRLLSGTLQVDRALLKVPEVAESFDTATFCVGQLVSHEPEFISKLPLARQVVSGLASALSKGWSVHHGVAKFAANALTILCICESADTSVRAFALEQTLQGLSVWLQTSDEPEEVDEVCGCNCGSAELSATCWLERLLGRPDALLEEELRKFPKLIQLSSSLLTVVTRRDGNPFSLTRLLCVPKVFLMLRDSDPACASEAFSFLVFGLTHFDNPMFTEDAVHAITVLLREGTASQVLAHCASVPLLEALSDASSYLPSAMAALELLADVPAGRTCMHSLAEALSASESPSDDNPKASATKNTSSDVETEWQPESRPKRTSGGSSAQRAITPETSAIAAAAVAASSSAKKGSSNSSNSGGGERRTPNRQSSGLASRALREVGALAAKLQGMLPTAVRRANGRDTNGRLIGGIDRPSERDLIEATGEADAGEADAGTASSHSSAGTASSHSSTDAGISSHSSHDDADSEDSDGESEGISNEAEALAAAEGSKSTEAASSGEAAGSTESPSSTEAAGSTDAAGSTEAAGSAGSTESAGADEGGHSELGGVEAWDQFVSELPVLTAAELGGAADFSGLAQVWRAKARSVTSGESSGEPSGESSSESSGESSGESSDSTAAIAPGTRAMGEAPEADGHQNTVELAPSALDPPDTVAHRTVGASRRSVEEGDVVPHWPNSEGIKPDVVKAWGLLDLAGFKPRQEEELIGRMTLSDKRIWLSRRLYREHHGGRMTEEDPILFVECTRDDSKGAVLDELRRQFASGAGLGGDLAGTLEVHFKDENSAGSAVRREWFSLVSEAFLEPEATLLTSPDNGQTVRPLPLSAELKRRDPDLATEKLQTYEMLGRFLGLALLQQVTVSVRLHRHICRLLLANGNEWEWTYEDVRALDEMLYKHKVQYVLHNPVEDLCLDFTDVLHDAPAGGHDTAAGGQQVAYERVPLTPGGEDIEVTEDNKDDFVHRLCDWRLFGCVREEMAAILRGLHVAVPPHIISQLSQLIRPEDLAHMLAGEPFIDIADWRRHTLTVGGLTRRSRTFRWFWKAVRSFDDKEREQLLQFATGSQRPPVGGFAHLQGFNGGVHKFTLCAGHEAIDSLPRAHACICTLDLPEYSNYAALRRAVHTALTMGSVGFDDAAVADGGDEGEGESEEPAEERDADVDESIIDNVADRDEQHVSSGQIEEH